MMKRSNQARRAKPTGTKRVDGWEERKARLQRFRKLRGLTGDAVANAAKVEPDYIRRIECGFIACAHRTTLATAARGYGLDPDTFARLLDGKTSAKAAAEEAARLSL
jgi:transcriptional regulator with XRE-family HTH domain